MSLTTSGARPWHRRFAVPLALGCAATLCAACGSRLSPQAIAAASHRPIVRSGSAAGGIEAVSGTGSATSNGSASGTSGSTATTTPAASTSTGSSTGQSGTGSTVHTGSTSTGSGSSGATSNAVSGSTVNLGNVGTYSGVIGAVFSGAQQALGVWQSYINGHGGLNGHPVHVYIEDDGGDPSTSLTDVQQEVTQDHVIAFVGNLVPLTVSASVSYLQQQNIPVIGGDASSAPWWQSPMLFPAASGIANEATFTIGAEVQAKGLTKMAMLYCVEDTTCTNGYTSVITDKGAQAEGVDPVYVSSYSITQPDFTAQCLDAKQAGANFIYFAGDGDSLQRMADDCSAQGYNPLYVGDSIAINAQDGSDPHLNGLLAGQTNFPWVDSFTPAQAAYQQAVKAYDPTLVGSASTTAEWASGMLAVAAAGNLGANPTSAQFLQGLWGIKNNNLGGLSPPLTFTQNQPATPSDCYFMMALQNGQFVDLDKGQTQCVTTGGT